MSRIEGFFVSLEQTKQQDRKINQLTNLERRWKKVELRMKLGFRSFPLGWVNMYNIFRFFKRFYNLPRKVPKQATFHGSLQK